jgi:alkyl hydroperoxide reductase subunit AhpC
MKLNEKSLLDFRVPALVGGQFKYLSGKQFSGRLLVMCFLPVQGIIAAAETLDEQSDRFERVNVEFLIVGSDACLHHQLWQDREKRHRATVLADPCHRVRRMFGIARDSADSRCFTVLLDEEGIVRLRWRHHFSNSDLQAIRNLVVLNRLSVGDVGNVWSVHAGSQREFLSV